MEENGRKRRVMKMDSPQAVRKALSRICNMVLNDELDPRAANTMIMGCNALLSSIRIDEQQKKIDELEIKINNLDDD